MNVFCRWGMHRPGYEKIFNQGREFTRCADCGTDLIEIRDRWRNIPTGKTVVWRKRTADDIFFVVTDNRRTGRTKLDLFGPLREWLQVRA